MRVAGPMGLEPLTRMLLVGGGGGRLPIFTFVNKLDRPAKAALELTDEIEAEFGISTYPLLWPIGSGDRFKGVLDRSDGSVHLFEKGSRGQQAEEKATLALDDPSLAEAIGDDDLYDALLEEAELLDELAVLVEQLGL